MLYRIRNIITLLALVCLCVGSPALAQSLNYSPTASIAITPEQPAPQQVVSLEIKSSLIDLNRADIEWFVDNVTAAQGVGLTRVKIHAGELGSKHTVTAVATGLDEATVRGTVIIQPTLVDIVWEAESFAPAGYRGRRFPSSGTYIRAEANAYFQRSNGTAIPKGELIYVWKRNGAVLGSVSGAGKYAIRIPTPSFLGESILTVEASTRDGASSASGLVRIPAVEPYLALYQDDPLRGLLLQNALKKKTAFSDDEITLAAIPFFASVTKLNDPSLAVTWSINGKKAPTDAADPSRITISRSNKATTARVGVSIESNTTLFQEATGSWNIEFGSAAASQNNPFITPNQ